MVKPGASRRPLYEEERPEGLGASFPVIDHLMEEGYVYFGASGSEMES